MFSSYNTIAFFSGLGSRSRSQSELGVFGSLEPEPFAKKPGAGAAWKKKSGAGAAKKLAGSSALREDKENKEIVLQLLFFS